MAQKPNFLKKFISSSLVGASTLAVIAGASSAALGTARNVGANINLNAAGVPGGIVTGDSLVYIVQPGGPFTGTADGGNDNGANPTVLVGSINMLQNGVFAVNGADIAIGSVSGTAGQLLTVNITTGNTLTLNGAPGVAGFPVNTYTNLGPVNFANAVSTFKISLAANGADGTKTAIFGNTATFNGTAPGGVIEIDAGNAVVFNGTIGNTNGIQGISLGANATATLNANTKLDGTLGAGGIELGNAAVLNVADGVNITGVTAANNMSIDGAAANNGAVNFLGASTVSTDIGSGQPVNAVNVAGVLTFQGGNNGAGSTFAAKAINLTGANSLIKFTTQNHAVTGNIVAGANGQGGFSVNGGDVTITGNIGANNASLATISFETDHTLKLIVPAPANNNLYVQNITTTGPNAGALVLQGNYNIFGNIGDKTNALKLVGILDDGAGGDATVTLKQGNSIYAQAIGLNQPGRNNTLQLEPGTTITGDIITASADNGILTLIKGADGNTGTATVVGDIGANGSDVQAINLGGNNLSFGGKNIYVAAGAGGNLNFAANETLTLTNVTDPIVIDGNITVTADQKGIIDGSALTNAQTLTFSNAKIGIIAPNANKTLNQLNIGSSKASLSGGDVAINELVIGNAGSVQIAHNTYLITKTTNAAGQGKMIIAPTANAGVTTLAAGTNLGSKANPLAEVNFAAPGALPDIILNVGQNTNLYATQFTTVTPNNGSFSFTNGGTNVIGGTVGTQANQFKNVTVTGGSTATFTGNAIFAGVSKIGANSTLQVGGNYTANSITANALNDAGTLEFVNSADATLTVAAAPANALSTVKFSGSGNVIFNPAAAVGAGGLGVNTPSFTFDGDSLGAKVFLAKGVALDNYTVISKVGNKGPNGVAVPIIVVNGADSTIAANKAIGDADNIVGIALASDNTITVNAPNLFAGIATTNDGQGTVELNGGNGNVPGTIYGLGVANGDPKLKLVTFTTNYTNLGSIIATKAIINDGLTVTTGGVAGTDFDGQITLGDANGNSTVIFADGTNSTATSAVVAFKANSGVVTYLGSAVVGNIGTSAAPVASVKFTGGVGKVEKLLGNIYAKVADFGTSNLVVGAPVTLGSTTTTINGNIDLQTNVLTFATGTTTWGAATSLNTTLSEESGVLGKIVIADGAVVNAQNVPLTVNVQDNASADFTADQTYTLIQGGKNFKGNVNQPIFVGGTNRFVNYTVSVNGDKDYILTRINDAANVFVKDISKSPYAGAAADVAAFVNPNNTVLARAAYANALKAKNATDSANFVGALVSNASAAITTANIDTAKDIMSTLGNRVNYVRYLGAPRGARENMLPASEGGAAVAAGDEAVDNVAYGAWVKPFYKDEEQKARGGVAGYKAKTTGGVFGLDTMVNDNLMIGAAVGITKTDMKHQGYNAGNKTDIDGVAFSLYGAQQLVNDFFAQGSAIFSVNQVKNKSKRYVFDNNGVPTKQVATGNYDNMTFGGNLMLGYDANVMEGMLITPMAGLNYLKSSDENYKETGATFVKQVNSKFSDRTDVIAGAKVMGNTMNISDFVVYPEAHAFITHKISGKLSRTQSYLDGQVQPYVANGDKTAKTSYNVGLSASVRPDAKMEYGFAYDFNVASKYTAHQGTLKVRVNF
ncbi:MAG TPA: autotransporter outer membrane beta-barrel domain-containing protein [Rickettsia endosymbiont of Pyrocoelia pectoralis]|nr:autotransporter outer membrane beta-barrel domain-containing protein [Rickettsia endosymbiont of Pyrocoelia pectoralis]